MILNRPDFPSEYETAGRKQLSREYNLEQKAFLEKKHGKSLREINTDPQTGRDLISLFECSECSGFLEVSALKHFDFDVEVAKCHRCQGLHI